MIKIKRAEFLSAILCAAKKDVRYYLNGLCIDGEGFIISTDGHRMFVGKAETDQETVIVSVKGKIPSKFDHVEIKTEELTIVFHDATSVLIQQNLIEIIDGRFPDWRRVDSYNEEKVSDVGLNLNYLNDAAKAAKFFGTENAKISFQGTSRGVHVRLSDTSHMVIMPCRI